MDRSNVRRGAASMVFFLLGTLTACGGDDPVDPIGGGGGGGGGGVTPVMTTAVDVKDNSFDPDLIQVSPGATVTWTWNATSNPHNVTFANTSITSSSTQNSGTFATAMPTTSGDYTYRCTIHSGMTGTVRVE